MKCLTTRNALRSRVPSYPTLEKAVQVSETGLEEQIFWVLIRNQEINAEHQYCCSLLESNSHTQGSAQTELERMKRDQYNRIEESLVYSSERCGEED